MYKRQGNNGVAVIRIEDNRNGCEGYTGDIFWNGGTNNGGNWNGGWWNDNWNGGGWGGGNNDNNGNWNGGGGWNNKAVSSCLNVIRGKVQQQTGGAQVNFNGSPRANKAGSFVMVDGNGRARGNNGRQGDFSYHCTAHPNGNVADSSYNWTAGNLGPTPR